MAKNIKESNKDTGKHSRRNGRRGRGKSERVSNPDNVRKGNVSSDYTDRGCNGNNDPSWYNMHGQLTLDAGNFSFNNPIGARISNLVNVNDDQVVRSFPGICAITTQTVPGISTDAFSPINVAARLLYDKVNYKNSRNFTYDAPDLMMYIYAVSSVYSYHAFLRRIYGVLSTYSQVNRFVPDGILKAMKVDPDSIRNNLSEFRYGINLLARKINALAVPAGMPLFERYTWLYTNVYMDAPTVKAGLYMFIPYGFYKYYENGSKGGFCSCESPKQVGGYYTCQTLLQFGNELIEALLSSQDINNMSTDILKAYEGNIVGLSDTPYEYAVVPVYNPEVLQQIHNCKMFGEYITDEKSQNPDGTYNIGSSGNLIQDPTKGFLKFTLENQKAEKLKPLHVLDTLLDVSQDNPTPDDVFVATRLTPSLDSNGNVDSCGSDVALFATLYIMEEFKDGSYGMRQVGGTRMHPTYNFIPWPKTPTVETAKACDAVMEDVSTWDKFDWSPFIYVTKNDNDEIIDTRIFGDIYNYTSISNSSLKKLHETAILSEFAVPVYGNRN